MPPFFAHDIFVLWGSYVLFLPIHFGLQHLLREGQCVSATHRLCPRATASGQGVRGGRIERCQFLPSFQFFTNSVGVATDGE